jgi:short-subunit dehydrogenase
MFSLAMVTGASSGIGADLCRLLADKGINLLISGRDHERLQALANDLRSKVDVMIFPTDLLEPSERASLIEKIHLYLPDLVINNAGFGLYGEALTYPTEDQMAIFEVNSSAVLELTLESGRAMVSNEIKGVIMNISSSAGFLVFPTMAVYAASKSFVNFISQSLDLEFQNYGIRVLAACPGMVNTNFRQRAGGEGASPVQEFVMTSPYAAKQIWRQIERRKPLHVFDWKYRVGLIFRYLIPKKWLAKILRNTVEGRYTPQEKSLQGNLILNDYICRSSIRPRDIKST